MAENQANPSTEDKISALEALVTKLVHKVDGMVSRNAMMRADSATRDDEARDDADSRDDDADRADSDRAAKDAARSTLFGGKRKDAKKDAKREDEARDDEDKDEDEDDDEDDDKKKEAKGDEDKDEDDKDKRDDASDEPEPMASDDDRRKDRRKDEARDDEARSDRKHDSPKRAHWRSDEDKDEDDKDKDDRKDAARADARADSMIRSLKRELDDLRRSMRRPRSLTDDELNALAERQQEWDRVAQMHGLRASRPLDGERIESYDRRIAKVFQKHSPKWKDADLSAMPLEIVNRVIGPEIRADAISAAYRVEPMEGGMLREVRRADRTGRVISEFVGPVDAMNGALAPFRMPSARVQRINTNPNQF